MSTEIVTPEQNQALSFEEFKKTILQQGTNANLLSWVANQHGRIPRLIRILYNFDPTNISSAIGELFDETVSEREQENIIRAIYDLSNKIRDIETREFPRLPDDKFEFLYHVYVRSGTSVFLRVEADAIQSLLGISQDRTISMGSCLERSGLIVFNSWVEGIKIVHKGIVSVETELLRSDKLPAYVCESEIKRIEERISSRFTLLRHLYKETDADTFKRILHADLARNTGFDHDLILTQLLPYMIEEGWVKYVANDSIAITEEGIDQAKSYGLPH